MKIKTLAVAAALFAVSAPSLAEGSKLTLSDVLSASDVTLSGRVEAGYDYANTTNEAAPTGAAFNTSASAFQLHQAALNIVKAPATGVGAAVTILAGEDARVLTGGDEVQLLQGYVSYTNGSLTVIGGRFLTLAGAEVIDSSANVNATRGILFNIQPTYHNGVRATYKIADSLSVTGGLMNSAGPADSGDDDRKTIELNATYTGIPNLTNSLTVYAGDEDSSTQDSGRYTLIDYVGSYALTPSTSLALNADYLSYENAKTDTSDGYGFAAYVNQKLGDKCRVAGRAEYLHISETVPGRNRKAFTLTYGHTVATGLELVAEARADLTGEKGSFTTNDTDSQYIGTVRAVYKF